MAASGVGKSVTRHRFISEPLDYILQNSNREIPDFEISHFTRPGKLIFSLFLITISVAHEEKSALLHCILQEWRTR